MLAMVDVSCAELTPEGILLADMWHQGVLKSILQRGEYICSTHHGGGHLLKLGLDLPDVRVFLEQVEGHYATQAQHWRERATAFCSHVRSKYPPL